MKKILIIIIFYSICNNLSAQTITPEYRDTVLTRLRSQDYLERYYAIEATYYYNIPEAVPILEEIFWQQDKALCFDILDALAKYENSNYISLAKDFFNVVDTMWVDERYSINDSPLEIKLDITTELIYKNDFSKVDFLFEYIEQKKPGSFLGSAFVIDRVRKNVPSYSDRAKTELFRIAEFDGIALIKICEYYGSEANEVAAKAFVGAKAEENRHIALKHLIQYNYPGIDTLLKSRVFVDTVWTAIFADDLLNHFGTPENYKFVKDNIGLVISPKKIKSIVHDIKYFEPPKPDTATIIQLQADDLFNSIPTMLSYTWLADNTFANELKTKLTTAKTNLQAGDSLACRVQVKAFQDLVDNVYKDSLNTDARFVTIEGWKFLYWNAQYILDRLPVDAYKKE